MELGFFSNFKNGGDKNTNENIIINQEDNILKIRSMYSIFKEEDEIYIFKKDKIKR